MKAKGIFLSVACLGLLSVAVAVAQEQAGGGEEGTKDDAERRSQVIVQTGDMEITVGEVEDAINAQSPFLRARYQDPEKLREFVDNMLRFELLAREAEERGYGDNPAVVRTVKQNAVQQMVREKFDEKITPKSISEEDVQEYYESHEAEFKRPEMVRAAHIRVATKDEAQKLYREARKADINAFRQLAREHSQDMETKHRGGDLRYFTQEGHPPGSKDASVAPELVKAAFSLRKPGDVASPVKVGEGWSVVMLTGRREAEEKPLEEAAQSIRLKLWRERRQQAVEEFVDSLRDKYDPEIHPKRMRPIQLDTAPPSAGLPGHGHGEAAGGGKAPASGSKPAAPKGEQPGEK